MKKPIFLILIGIGVLLVVGVVVVGIIVVPWFGEMKQELDQIAEQQAQQRRALRKAAREPLTEEQTELLSQLLEITAQQRVPTTVTAQQSEKAADGKPSKDPTILNDLEEVLSSEPYLAYLKAWGGENYEDFSAYVAAMPTPHLRSVARARVKVTLGADKDDEELEVWTNYYFIIREWGTTVQDPRDNMTELQEIQQAHLITPLMGKDPDVSGLHIKMVQIGMFSMSMTEHNSVFQKAWRERLEAHGEQEGPLRCAIASPSEFALMRSFFADMTAFQEWIRTDPDSEEKVENPAK